MMHSLRIKGGKVFYHNSWLQTPRLQFERARGRAYFSRLGELTGKIGILKAITAMTRKIRLAGLNQYNSGQANTAIGIIPDGRLWALHEASYPFEFRLTEQGGISSVGYETAAGKLTCAVSAHPKVDMSTQETFFHSYDPSGGPSGTQFLLYGHFDAAGALRTLINLEVRSSSFSHDMLLSENFAIILDSSVRFDPAGILDGSMFSFDAAHRTRLAVIPRNASSIRDVRWFETPRSLAWVHPLHAWEEDGGRTLVLWAPLGFEAPRTGGILDGCCDLWYMGEIRLNLRSTTPLSTDVEIRLIDEKAQHHGEFSRIRDDLVGRGFARYGYTALANSTTRKDFDFVGFTKWDMLEKAVAAELLLPPGWTGGEPVFIPSAASAQAGLSPPPSDDGYLANFMYGPDPHSTDFVLYDAKTFSAEPVARLRVPRRVPVGFHGSWLSREALARHTAHVAPEAS